MNIGIANDLHFETRLPLPNVDEVQTANIRNAENSMLPQDNGALY